MIIEITFLLISQLFPNVIIFFKYFFTFYEK